MKWRSNQGANAVSAPAWHSTSNHDVWRVYVPGRPPTPMTDYLRAMPPRHGLHGMVGFCRMGAD